MASVLDLVATLTLDNKEYKSKLDDSKKEASTFGEVLKANLATDAIVAGVKAALNGIKSITVAGVQAYSQYEQLSGGVKKLYGDASDELMSYANQAYKTAGMSANKYMEQATSFSASLINSLGGDVSKAAKQTDVAMKAISDNVNTFGTDVQSVSYAFQGFAKSNYTMLDNLKLGYGGTKTEMERLIADANEYAKSIGQASNLSIDSFSDVVTAIELIQEKQGIAGTTAKEAMTTLEGSANATKAAWENVITAIAKGEGLPEALEQLKIGLLGEAEGEGLINQLIPRIKQVFEGIADFIKEASPYISDALPDLIVAILPSLIEAAATLALGVAGAIPEIIKTVWDSIIESINDLKDMLNEESPGLGDTFEALTVVVGALTGAFIAFKTAMMITETIEALKVAMGAFQASTEGLTIAQRLLNLVMNANPFVLIATLIAGLVSAIIVLWNTNDGFRTACENVWNSIKSTVSNVIENVKQKWNDAVTFLKNLPESAKTWAKDMIDNFVNGIKNKINDVKNAAKNIAQTVRNFIGFSEPKEGPLSVFHTFAPDMIDLFTQGIAENEGKLTDQISKSFDFSDSIVDNPPTTESLVTSGTSNDSKIDAIINMLAEYLPQVSNTSVVLDTGALVGQIAPTMDSELGRLTLKNARGVY